MVVVETVVSHGFLHVGRVLLTCYVQTVGHTVLSFGSTIDLSAARASDDAFSGVSATVHSVLCDCFMNPSSTQRCSICSRGVKNPPVFTITILPLYRPSCFKL